MTHLRLINSLPTSHMHHSIRSLLLFSLIFWVSAASAESNEDRAASSPEPTLMPRLALPFTDNAILQRDMNVPVWGLSLPGASVTVFFHGQEKKTIADNNGKWKLKLDPMKAISLKTVNDSPEGKTMVITCSKEGKSESLKLNNILVGDVWLAAGQSNMAGRMKRAGHPKNFPPNSINAANYPSLRHFNMGKNTWEECNPETAVWISRVTFFFIRRVQKDILIPMGVFTTAVGGSNIESWLNQPPYPTGGNYTRLLKPFVGFGIKGAIWYQGESNENDKRGYHPKLKSLILGWRKAWGQNDFPVHYVQLPGIRQSNRDNPAGGDGRAEIRQAYFETLSVPNTGMAVTLDVGTPGEHPPNKYNTGDRLARSVLNQVYGIKSVTACPLYTSHHIEGNSIRVSFTPDASVGLMIAKKEGFLPPVPTPEEKLDWLSIQSEDGSWHWATGKIDGAELIVSSDKVTKPIAVR